MIATIALALRIVMAIALYYFLGRALLTLWQELRQQAGNLALQKHSGINLDIVIGQDQTTPHRFTKDEIVIGRERNCDLPLTDEAVSAHHAYITFHHRQWWLEDLNSTNGTFLNHEKLNMPTVLTSGDEINCGGTVIRVRIGIDDKTPSNKQLQTGGIS